MKELEWNGLKGAIGEHLAKSFIRSTLSKEIISQEGWSHVVFSNNDYKLHARKEKLFSFDRYREDFLVHGYYADTKLLSRYAETADTLMRNHCSPDGLLMKLKENGAHMQLKEADCPRIANIRFDTLKNNGNIEFPVASGDLEIVEIKCGRNAKLMNKQKETYNNLIAKGVPLRMIKVKIVSFDSNKFLVEQHKYEKFL